MTTFSTEKANVIIESAATLTNDRLIQLYAEAYQGVKSLGVENEITGAMQQKFQKAADDYNDSFLPSTKKVMENVGHFSNLSDRLNALAAGLTTSVKIGEKASVDTGAYDGSSDL